MLKFFRNRKRNKMIKKVKPGDGHTLKPYRVWHIFTRSLFYADIKNEEGQKVKYAVNCKYFDEDSKAYLYRNGKHIATSLLPATFPVTNGVIEVSSSSYGINRIAYVEDSGESHPMYPDKRSIRGLRVGFDKRFPKISSLIGVLAAIILLVSLVLTIPQVIEYLTKIPWVEENIGTFNSPILLPAWANFSLLGAATLAGIDRTLMLRNHWLIDMETGYWVD